jgi:putative endonuclease
MLPKTAKQGIGMIGEEIACRFLTGKGYSVVSRNYRKKWGEIDIIAKKEGKISFIEVKTMNVQTKSNVSRETLDELRPEEHVDRNKLRRFGNAIRSYLEEFHIGDNWMFHVIAIDINTEKKTACIRFIEDLPIS